MTTVDTLTETLTNQLKRAKLRFKVLSIMEAQLEQWHNKKLTKRFATDLQTVLGDRYHVYYTSDQTTVYLTIRSIGHSPMVDEKLILLYKPTSKDGIFNFHKFQDIGHRSHALDAAAKLEGMLNEPQAITDLVDFLSSFKATIRKELEIFNLHWDIVHYMDKQDYEFIREVKFALPREGA